MKAQLTKVLLKICSGKLQNGLQVSFQAIKLHFETLIADNKIHLLVTKCENFGFNISLRNTIGILHTQYVAQLAH
jgi:predicted ABC-type ATPase